MENERENEGDYFIIESERIRSSLTPRLIIIDENGNFPLVRYKDTSWLGLPGGKAKEEEVAGGGNFLSTGAFPTLTREVHEECGIDISDNLDKSACLGLAEIGIVDNVKRSLNFTLTPIFVCKTDQIGAVSETTQIVNIKEHLPGPLFPDARIAIRLLREGIGHDKGLIQTTWLTDSKIYYFEIRPQMKNLSGPPDWLHF